MKSEWPPSEIAETLGLNLTWQKPLQSESRELPPLSHGGKGDTQEGPRGARLALIQLTINDHSEIFAHYAEKSTNVSKKEP